MKKMKLMAALTVSAMALSLAVPFNASAINDQLEVELYDTYLFEDFMALDEETIISIHQELAPDVDAAVECEAVKTAGAEALENDEVNFLTDISLEIPDYGLWTGDNNPYDFFEITLNLMESEMFPTYRTSEYDGVTHIEYRVETDENNFNEVPLEPKEIIYRLYVWLLAHPYVNAVRVEDTSFTSCGLTEEEIYAKYTFDDIMKLTPEEICSFSKEIKNMYKDLASTIDYLGFVNNIKVIFASDYTNKLKTNNNLIAAREETGEMLRLPDELYWGISPSFSNSIISYTDIFLHEENIEAMAESYGLTVGDFIARVRVWLNLNPDVTESYYGFIPEGMAGAINPDILYDDDFFSIEKIAVGSPNEIYTLPFYSSQYFIDALVYARDNGIDSVDTMYKQRFRVSVYTNDNFFNDDGTMNQEKLNETLHIDANWLRNGCICGNICDDESRPLNKWMYIDINEEFYDSLISNGCEYTDAFAAVYTWLKSNNDISDVIIEENPEYIKPEIAAGEINRDGKVSLLDVVLLCKYTAGSVTLNSSQLEAADCTGDSIVNSSDVTALQMYIVEKISVLPVVI